VSAGWVAGGVRAQAMSRRRLGEQGARDLLETADLVTAVDRLAASPYGHDVRRGMGLERAQHAVSQTLVWNLRVLAGWLPRPGVEVVRVLAGWAELANLERLVRGLRAGTAAPDVDGPPPYVLGALATVWPRVAGVTDRAALRAALTASPWGDPGADDDRDLVQVLRLTWSARVATGVGPARSWARSAAALLVAHDLATRGLAGGDPPSAAVQRATARVLGPAAAQAASLGDLRAALDRHTAASLDDADDLTGLWRCEVAWWRSVRRDARALTTATSGPEPVVGQVAALAADAWLTRAALAAAARRQPPEVLDELR
jgi:hypothetical protein